MKFQKWIQLKSKRETIASVVPRMLCSRLAAVAHYLPLVAKVNKKHVESVHQLRVWCRRTMAALKLCKSCLSEKQLRQLQRGIKKIMAAAGSVRDLNVLQRYVAQRLKASLRSYLLQQIQEQHQHAQKKLQRVARSFLEDRSWQKLPKKIAQRIHRQRKRKPFCKPFVPWCDAKITKWVEQFTAGVGQEPAELSRWHEYRITGKRLRYGWELAAGVASVKKRQAWCDRLARLQTELGDLHDADIRVKQYQAYYDAAPNRAVRSALLRVIRREEAAVATALEQLNHPELATITSSEVLPLKKMRRSKSQG